RLGWSTPPLARSAAVLRSGGRNDGCPGSCWTAAQHHRRGGHRGVRARGVLPVAHGEAACPEGLVDDARILRVCRGDHLAARSDALARADRAFENGFRATIRVSCLCSCTGPRSTVVPPCLIPAWRNEACPSRRLPLHSTGWSHPGAGGCRR